MVHAQLHTGSLSREAAPQTEFRLSPTPHLSFLLALIQHPAPPVCTFPDRSSYKLKLNKYHVGLILNNSVVVPRFQPFHCYSDLLSIVFLKETPLKNITSSMLYHPLNTTFERSYCLSWLICPKYKLISGYLPFFPLSYCKPLFALLAAVTPYLYLHYRFSRECFLNLSVVLLISSISQSAFYIYLQ